MTPALLSLCSGIGGLELGIEQATGAKTIAQVEIDAFARGVLARHWPDAERIDNVSKVGIRFRGVDIVCGGFPCTPHSLAGSRKSSEDDRDLWPEMARIMREVQPKAAIFENVPGLLTSRTDPKNDATKGHFFLCILRDLESAGYTVRWDCCPASAVGALHRRDRVFIAATRTPSGWPAMSAYPIAPESMWGHPQPLEWPRAGCWMGGQAYQARPRWPIQSVQAFCTPTVEDASRVGDPGMAERWANGETIPECHQRLRTQALIPTPQATESRNCTSGRTDPDSRHHGGTTIYDFVRLFPTPQTSDANGAGTHGEGGVDLRTAVSLLPTPTSRDWKDGDAHSIANVPDNGLLGRVAARGTEAGALNPDWVEWLMGFPVGWTDVEGPSMHDAIPLPLHTEPAIPRVTTRKNDRRLRLCRLGNAVVHQVARTVAEAML